MENDAVIIPLISSHQETIARVEIIAHIQLCPISCALMTNRGKLHCMTRGIFFVMSLHFF